MNDTVEETVTVLIGWSDDWDDWWLSEETDLSESDDEQEHQFVCTVPKRLWDEVTAARAASKSAQEALIAATDLDATEGLRRKAACPTWLGMIRPGDSWTELYVEASGRDDTWPTRELRLGHEQDPKIVDARIAALPEEFQLMDSGRIIGTLRRDQIRHRTRSYDAATSACFRCGWPRGEHADPGAEVER